MSLPLQNNELHVSALLQPIFLSQYRFLRRFVKTFRLEDPYARVYDICNDTENNNKRVAVKDYCASTKQQRNDVLMNLQSYRSLQQIEGISKVIAFCHVESTGDIMAAFEYNDSTLSQLIAMQFFQDNRNQFYLFILKELLYVHQNAKNFGIELQDLIPSNILLYHVQNYFRIKILFDQREKKYDKILEGIKVFCSIESIENLLGYQNHPQRQESNEFVFELGLLLLDFVYAYEFSSIKRPSLKQMGKIPDLDYKGYHIFDSNASIKLNYHLINQKKKFLMALGDPFIQGLIRLIEKMIAAQTQRISLKELTLYSQMLVDHSQPQKIATEVEYDTPSKEISPIREKKSPNDSLKYSEDFENPYIEPYHKNVATSTTIPKNVFMDSAPQIDSKVNNSSQVSINYNLIPKNKILAEIKAPNCIKDQLSKFIALIQNKSTVVKQQYLDGSTYYGELDPPTQKRQGVGMYFYYNGDLYFGNWKANVLVDGIYIFKKGQCYEGVVRNGKQGWGRYYYANGNIYQGDWRDDLKCGRGKMTYQNGEVYEGMWYKGKRSGEGTYYYRDGSVYKGNFSKGKKEGFGCVVFPNHTRVEAYWLQNHIQGKGKVFYANGHYYQGQFSLSQKQGQGIYKWQDQTKYEGGFKNDTMLGQAKVKFFQNQFYQGHIQNGKRQGHGTYRYINGDQFKGQWKNDEKIRGQYRFHDGRSFDGRFKKNQMSHGVMIYQNGDSYQGQFANGQRHGMGTYRNSAGDILYDGKWVKDKFAPNL